MKTGEQTVSEPETLLDHGPSEDTMSPGVHNDIVPSVDAMARVLLLKSSPVTAL